MQQFNVFQAIFMSFYSKKLYRDIALNWGGKSFLYLLMLLTIVSIYCAIALQFTVKEAYQEFYKTTSPQMPVVTIKDGKISTPENRPYFITDANKNNVALIDTTGQYTTIEQAKTNVLVTQTQIIIQSKPNETKTYTIPANLEQKVDPQNVNGIIQKFLGFLWIIFIVFILLSLYIYRLLQAFLYAILGKIFALIFKVQLSYSQVLQIAMVALTPAIILSVLQYSFNLHIPHELLLYFLLTLMYLFYGIIANKN